MSNAQLIEAYSDVKVRIDFTCTVQLVDATHFCPCCQRKGNWRQGVHFEHEMRCGDCEITWEPHQQYLLIEKEESQEDANQI